MAQGVVRHVIQRFEQRRERPPEVSPLLVVQRQPVGAGREGVAGAVLLSLGRPVDGLRHGQRRVESFEVEPRQSPGQAAVLAVVEGCPQARHDLGPDHNLVRLATALRVGIEELLARPRAECVLVAAGEVPVQIRSGGGSRQYKLLPDPLPGMEIDRLELESGARLRGVPHLERTREYLTVVTGEVALHVAGESYRVQPGDVLAFPGDRPTATTTRADRWRWR